MPPVAAARDVGAFRPHRARLPADGQPLPRSRLPADAHRAKESPLRVEEFAQWSDAHREYTLAVIHGRGHAEPAVALTVRKQRPARCCRHFLQLASFGTLEAAIDLARRGVVRERAGLIQCGGRTLRLTTMADGSIRGHSFDAGARYKGHVEIPHNILGALEGAIKMARTWAGQSE